jgi:hypothetical protein
MLTRDLFGWCYLLASSACVYCQYVRELSYVDPTPLLLSASGCLPSLATIPIFIGLYRSLTNVANEGLLDTQGFYWIPTLAGPTTMAANRAGSGEEGGKMSMLYYH